MAMLKASSIQNIAPISPETKPHITLSHQLTNQKVPGSLTLKVTRKAKNSPILSIQKFIHHHLIYQPQTRPLTTQKLWNKYHLDEENSLIIKDHELDFVKFKQIAEPILETIKLHQVEVTPIYHRPYSTETLNSSMCGKVI